MKTDTHVYSDGDKELHGFLAIPDGHRQRPGRAGILLVHDGFGLGEHARERARTLCELGYVVLAADLYGGAKTVTSLDEAIGLMGEFHENAERLRQRANAGLRALSSLREVDATRLGAVGYCFGGATVLEMARAGLAGLKGCVSFHGLLKTSKPARAGEVAARILVLNGSEDSLVPAQDVLAFQEEMRTAQATWELTTYGGAKHAFTNPGIRALGLDYLDYNELADRRSWAAMAEFFDQVLA
jgi:dienelactone hydrolase